jgi:hypothetical protein
MPPPRTSSTRACPRGNAASVRDTAPLASALDRAAQDLGPIEVLEYSRKRSSCAQ